jgi:hypothetical protein
MSSPVPAPARLDPSYVRPGHWGYLTKYAGTNFQTRFFVLRGTILLYYVDHAAPDPKGVFLLDEATLTRGAKLLDRSSFGAALFANADKATPFSLVLRRPSGLAWELCAQSEAELDGWVAAFVATGAVTRLADVALFAPPMLVTIAPAPPAAAPASGTAPPASPLPSRQGAPPAPTDADGAWVAAMPSPPTGPPVRAPAPAPASAAGAAGAAGASPGPTDRRDSGDSHVAGFKTLPVAT